MIVCMSTILSGDDSKLAVCWVSHIMKIEVDGQATLGQANKQGQSKSWIVVVLGD